MLNIFPYIIFASGCDFHYTESISKRFEQGNYGYPNKTINVTTTVVPVASLHNIKIIHM